MATEFDSGLEPDNEEENESHLVGLYNGTVVDNADPLELGRVRVNISGLIDPASAWALPAGTLGGGSAARGFYAPPDIEADVFVMFAQGDVDSPVYWSGYWGIPDAGTETPGPEPAAGKSERVKIKTFETARFQMVFDERDGELKWFILDKESSDLLELSDGDGFKLVTAKKFEVVAAGDASVAAGGDASVSAGGAMDLSASGNVGVTGAQIQLNGSIPVGRVGDAVQVTIPPGIYHVTNPFAGPPTIPAPLPIIVTGVIIAGSATVKAG